MKSKEKSNLIIQSSLYKQDWKWSYKQKLKQYSIKYKAQFLTLDTRQIFIVVVYKEVKSRMYLK